MHIKIQGITKIYRISGRPLKVLDGIDMQIPAGSFSIIFGPSGAGKTTLLSIISGIEKPSSGRIFFDYWDLTTLSEKELADFRLNTIGFIFQNFNLIPSLTVSENVSLPMIRLKSKAEVLQRVNLLLEKVGIGERADNLPDTLSVGEKQRVAVARALANKPKIILADEPISNLEDASAEKILQLLHKINQEDKVTVILATNSTDVSRQRCDRLYRIESGRSKV